jgi:hypothetical protein
MAAVHGHRIAVMHKHSNLSLFIGLLAAFLVGACAVAPPIAPPKLAGHWTARLPMAESDSIQLVVDLAMLDSRWIGEFDVPEFEATDYPVQVTQADSVVMLRFAGADAVFAGRLSDDAQRLSGAVQFAAEDGHQERVPAELRRTGEAQFSAAFWELERAAADSSRVTRLAADGAELRRQFNADRGKTRLLMLLSPS